MKGDFVCAATQKGEDKLRPYHWSVPCRGDHEDRPYLKKKAHMATERDILQALEGLPTSALEQVKDFIIFLKETKGSQRPLLKEKAIAKKQIAAIKKWAGTNLRTGFSGREHDAIFYQTR